MEWWITSLVNNVKLIITLSLELLPPGYMGLNLTTTTLLFQWLDWLKDSKPQDQVEIL